MIQKWPIWKLVRGPRWCRFRVHKSVPFWAIFGGPLTIACGPRTVTQGALFCRKKRFFVWGAPNWLRTRGQMWSPNRLSSIYIYIYYAGELFVCPPVGLVESYSLVHRFVKIPFLQQPTANSKLLVWPPESYLFVHFLGPFLTPKGGQTNNPRGGQTNNFQMALCSPIFGPIWAMFWKPEP